MATDLLDLALLTPRVARVTLALLRAADARPHMPVTSGDVWHYDDAHGEQVTVAALTTARRLGLAEHAHAPGRGRVRLWRPTELAREMCTALDRVLERLCGNEDHDPRFAVAKCEWPDGRFTSCLACLPCLSQTVRLYVTGDFDGEPHPVIITPITEKVTAGG